MFKLKLTEEQIKYIIHRYELLENIHEIGENLCLSHKVIQRVLKENNIPKRSFKESVKVSCAKDQANEILQRYNNKEPLTKIIKEVKVKFFKIKEILFDNDIKLREEPDFDIYQKSKTLNIKGVTKSIRNKNVDNKTENIVITKEQEIDIINKANSKMSIIKIHAATGIYPIKIKEILIKNNIPLTLIPIITDELENKIIEKYKAGDSCLQIKRDTGVYRKKIVEILLKNNVLYKFKEIKSK